MDIKQTLQILITNNNWQKVDEILSEAKGKISWGNAIVIVPGFKGSISLDDLVKKVSSAAKTRCISDNLNINQRCSGIKVTKKLIRLCTVTNQKLKKTNSLIKWINGPIFSKRANLRID